jgi:hypothetical protein
MSPPARQVKPTSDIRIALVQNQTKEGKGIHLIHYTKHRHYLKKSVRSSSDGERESLPQRNLICTEKGAKKTAAKKAIDFQRQ